MLPLLSHFISFSIFLILNISCNASPSDEKAVNAAIDAHLAFMREHHGMMCMGQGMGSPNGKIENISLFLTRTGPHTIEEARRLAISGLEDFSRRLNQIDKGPDTLTTFPCSADNLYYGIYFTDGKGKILNFTKSDPNISSVIITRSRIIYLSSEKPHGPSQTILTERYVDAVRAIRPLD